MLKWMYIMIEVIMLMKENEQHPSFMLVDGMALLFRAFYATAVTGQFMINSKGIPTNAVQGFLKHMLTAVNHFSPSHVAVCWDMGSKTFRNELFDGYKANRSEAPVEMIPQFDLAKKAVEAFDIPNIGLSGYEADDCIGTIAKASAQHSRVGILTGDQDMLQLIENIPFFCWWIWEL
jgi:5'-3' exonuclease